MIRKMLDNSDLVSKAAVRWSLIGVFVINAAITLTVAFNASNNDDDINRIAATQHLALGRIQANTAHADKTTASLQKALTTQCNDRNTAAVGTNAVLDSLLEAVKVTKSLPPAEKAERVALYNSVKVRILDCTIGIAPSQYKVAERPASTRWAPTV